MFRAALASRVCKLLAGRALGRFKPAGFVRTVAERTILRGTTATQCDHRLAAIVGIRSFLFDLNARVVDFNFCPALREKRDVQILVVVGIRHAGHLRELPRHIGYHQPEPIIQGR